jgi:hypothetical protein
MHQRNEVFSNLEAEKIAQCLEACGLTDKAEYTEDEALRIFSCRELMEQGKTKKQISAYFQQEDKKRSSSEPLTAMNILEMLNYVNEQSGLAVELSSAVQIMTACGLSPNQKQYSQSECKRFLKASELMHEQGNNLQTVAAHFGVDLTAATQQKHQQHITDHISDAAASSEAGLINLVDKVTEKRAEEIPGLVNKLYLKNVSRQLSESQEDIQSFYAQLEERILEQIEGKSPLRAIMATDLEMKPLLPSSDKPIPLPPESENGTNTD